MILIAAGSNVPFCGVDSQQLVLSSFYALQRVVDVYQISPLYEAPAWPDPSDPVFVNAVAVARTDLPPATLLSVLHTVERAFGRVRSVKNAPRTLDLDLIAHGDHVLSGEAGGPVLPHPGVEMREFVLAPLCDIAPDWRSPSSGKTAAEMLSEIKTGAVQRIS